MAAPTIERIGEHLFVNADCVRGAAAHLADGSVDLMVTDPPYGIEGDRLDRHYNQMCIRDSSKSWRPRICSAPNLKA